MKVKNKLNEMRKKAEMTMRELAKGLGVSTQTVFNYERGKYNPSEKTFNKMKKLLHLTGDYEDFFDRKSLSKYGPGDKCKREGCTKPPKSSGYCMTHYISEWRRKKRLSEKKVAKKKVVKKKMAKKKVAKKNSA